MFLPGILLIFTADLAFPNQLTDWIAPFGWHHICVNPSPADARPAATPAVILLDGRLGQPVLGPLIRQIRDLPGPDGGVPIILCAVEGSPDCPGVNDRIALPLDESAFVAMLQLWAGPLADHGYRDMGSPRYRLTRLAGTERASALLDNFATALSDALSQIGEGENLRMHAHQIAGMAGTIGYGDLGRAWAAVDRGAGDALDTARRMAEDVLLVLKAEKEKYLLPTA